MRSFLLTCLTIGLANSLVDFSNSVLYDVYDFKGKDEVQITKCDFGCLIFAATMGEGFEQYADKLDPFASNLFIVDNNKGTNVSIAHLAQQREANNRKIPLTITGQAKISVVNLNDPNEKVVWTIVLYVIEKTIAENYLYEVYDYVYSTNTKITSQLNTITILSAYDYRIQADPTNQPNSVRASLVGFENALENNNNGCPYAYKTPDSKTFPGFTLMVNTPIISIVNEKRSPIELRLDLSYSSIHGMSPNGYFSSSGWNGCTKPNNGGIQSFRQRNDESVDMYILDGKEDSFNVTMEVLPNFDDKHKLTISERNNLDSVEIKGPLTLLQNQFFQDTDYLIIDLYGMSGDQGFILRYSSEIIPKITTAGPVTIAGSSIAPQSSTTTQNPTTSSGFTMTGSVFSMMLLFVLLQ